MKAVFVELVTLGWLLNICFNVFFLNCWVFQLINLNFFLSKFLQMMLHRTSATYGQLLCRLEAKCGKVRENVKNGPQNAWRIKPLTLVVRYIISSLVMHFFICKVINHREETFKRCMKYLTLLYIIHTFLPKFF